MDEKDAVIKHRGRRFKRSSLKSNGPLVVKPPKDAPSQFQPNEPCERNGSQNGTQKGKIYENLKVFACMLKWCNV